MSAEGAADTSAAPTFRFDRLSPPPPLTAAQRRWVSSLWVIGGLLRMLYVFVMHPATAYVFSDMNGYVQRAVAYFGPYAENIGDTLYPPGATVFFGALYRLDPRWNLAEMVQWLLSLCVMHGVWLLARRLYGNTVAIVALGVTAFYFPLFHYAALFMAENPFTFFLMLSLWLFLCAVQARTRAATLGFALACGLAAGVGTSFKTSILGPVLLVGLAYSVYAWKFRRPHYFALAIAASAMVLLSLAPLSWRCTRLVGDHFCLVSTNGPMNMLQGHYGDAGLFHWYDAGRNITFDFGSPTEVLRGHDRRVDLDWGAYDSQKNLALAHQWIAAHPREALYLSGLHIWDLFVGRTLWPYAQFGAFDLGRVWQPIGAILVLVPSALWVGRRARAWLRFEEGAFPEWLLLAPILGLMLIVFIGQGEIRYRVPFDGLMVVLAARFWVALGGGLAARLARWIPPAA